MNDKWRQGWNLSRFTLREVRLLAMGVLLLALTTPYLFLAASPNLEEKQSWCPVKLATGLPCPGCGMFKSWCFLTHGQWLHSFHHHPLGMLLYAFTLFMLVWAAVEYYQNRVIPLPWQGNVMVVYWVFAVVMAVHLYRLYYLMVDPARLLAAWHQGYVYKAVAALEQLF